MSRSNDGLNHLSSPLLRENERGDQLYELLPAVYRIRDTEQKESLSLYSSPLVGGNEGGGEQLRSLLQVISEQVDVVEDDISQNYENWFIETCQDWVVPYIADLIGYRIVNEAGTTGDITTLNGQQLNKVLIPRREVANTIRYRRRKGTLFLLEQLANDVTGWSVRVVEFYKLLSITQHMNHLRPMQGQTVDLRQGKVLNYLDTPFDELSHTVDVRSINSHRTPGKYNIPNIGLFVWRLKSYSVTKTAAYCLEDSGPHCYTFSILGNDIPLYTKPEPQKKSLSLQSSPLVGENERGTEPTQIAGPLNLPIPIRRRLFEEKKKQGDVVKRYANAAYYGQDKSIAIWAGSWANNNPEYPIPRESIIPADLSDWRYHPPRNHIAVDPELGRISFPIGQLPKQGVWVTYHYGFSADLGGGEYERQLKQPTERLLLTEDDFKKPNRLFLKLRDAQDLVSHYLKSQFSPEERRLLDEYNQNIRPGSSTLLEENERDENNHTTSDSVEEVDSTTELQKIVVAVFNRVLQSNSLYNQERFAGVTLTEHTKKLLAQNPQGKNLIRLNRWLLEDAYPQELSKSYILYRVGEGQRINEALRRWRRERPRNAIIEITDSGVYVEQINIKLRKNQTLQIRAANRTRPVIRLLDWHTDLPDNFSIRGATGSSFTLDGILISGRGLEVTGDLAEVNIRHCTLVPGWGLHCDCEPRRPAEPSLELNNSSANITIENSILGSIQVNQDAVKTDPIQITISDSILDATNPKREALGAPGCPVAHAILTIVRTTVFGQIQVHAINLAENSIFNGLLKVARRQQGCMRFCSYIKPGSRTPRRYNCQPDLVEEAITQKVTNGEILPEEMVSMQERERFRVRPQFNSIRYGTPAYCQLAESCAIEIKRGADDESEMGVFHNLYQPQRDANLRVRLNEYTPAGSEVGIIYSS